MRRIAIAAVLAVGTLGLSSSPAKAGFTINLGGAQVTGNAFGPNTGGINIYFEKLTGTLLPTVKLTISNNTTNLLNTLNVHVQAVLFNLHDNFWTQNGSDWTEDGYFTHIDGVEAATNHDQIEHDKKQFAIVHEEMFDVEFSFTGQNQFWSGENSIYTFTYTGNRTDFDEYAFWDVNSGPPPDFHAGVHYGYTGNNGGSGKSLSEIPVDDGGLVPEAVPTPTSVLGLLLAGAGLFVCRGWLSFG